MILHSKICRMDGGGFHSRNPQAKVSSDGGGGGGGGSFRNSVEKLYKSSFCFYIYPDGTFEVAKNRLNGIIGNVDVDDIVPILSRVISDLKLKEINSEMFKEGLSELLQEAIQNTLKGEYYERAIRAKSSGHGS